MIDINNQARKMSGFLTIVCITSQFGEDGVLKIFEIIGKSKWCVELGALNGVHDSNVRIYFNTKGWSGVLIEADITSYKTRSSISGTKNVICVNEFVSFEGITLWMLYFQVHRFQRFELLSLDIDGNEYHYGLHWTILPRNDC